MTDVKTLHPPTRGRGRGRGRGGGRAGRPPGTTKAAAANGNLMPLGRRGRQKVYDEPRTQAAYERCRDLRGAYAQLAEGMVSMLEELGERNLDLLRNEPEAHLKCAEFEVIERFLKLRRDERVRKVKEKYRLGKDETERVKTASCESTARGYRIQIDEAVDEFYDVQAKKLDILEHLYHNSLDVETPDDSYAVKDISSQNAAAQLGQPALQDGFFEPFATGLAGPQVPDEPVNGINGRTPRKRKPTERYTDQPTPKRPARGRGRRGALLSGLSALEEEPSRPPSRTSQSPDGEPSRQRRGSSSGSVQDVVPAGALPPIPVGAGEPDEYGVRQVYKKAKLTDVVTQRIMYPALYEYDPEDIGFRDSTNCSTLNATRAKRGMYVDTPNSNNWFTEQMHSTYDCAAYEEDDLDKSIIEKHKLHPTYGMFLKTSVNEAEPPAPVCNGQKPVALVAADGRTIHASRSVWHTTASDATNKAALRRSLAESLEDADMKPNDLIGDEAGKLIEERDAKRLRLEKEQEERAEAQHQEELAKSVQTLLEASEHVEEMASTMRETRRAKKAKEAGKGRRLSDDAQAKAPAKPHRTSSKAYDAVRDIFAGSSTPVPDEQPVTALDTTALSILADATDVSRQPPVSAVLEAAPRLLSPRSFLARQSSVPDSKPERQANMYNDRPGMIYANVTNTPDTYAPPRPMQVFGDHQQTQTQQSYDRSMPIVQETPQQAYSRPSTRGTVINAQPFDGQRPFMPVASPAPPRQDFVRTAMETTPRQQPPSRGRSTPPVVYTGHAVPVALPYYAEQRPIEHGFSQRPSMSEHQDLGRRVPFTNHNAYVDLPALRPHQYQQAPMAQAMPAVSPSSMVAPSRAHETPLVSPTDRTAQYAGFPSQAPPPEMQRAHNPAYGGPPPPAQHSANEAEQGGQPYQQIRFRQPWQPTHPQPLPQQQAAPPLPPSAAYAAAPPPESPILPSPTHHQHHHHSRHQSRSSISYQNIAPQPTAAELHAQAQAVKGGYRELKPAPRTSDASETASATVEPQREPVPAQAQQQGLQQGPPVYQTPVPPRGYDHAPYPQQIPPPVQSPRHPLHRDEQHFYDNVNHPTAHLPPQQSQAPPPPSRPDTEGGSQWPPTELRTVQYDPRQAGHPSYSTAVSPPQNVGPMNIRKWNHSTNGQRRGRGSKGGKDGEEGS